MNTPVPAGLSSYPTVSGQRYRVYGVAQNVTSDTAVQNALVAAGLLSLTYYTDASTLPTDWPTITAPPLSADERAFYADGTWSISGQLPTSITVGSGTLILFDVWIYAPDVNPGVQQTSLTTSSSSSATSSTSTGTYVAIGALVLAAGFVATLMLLPKHAHANPIGASRAYVEQFGSAKVFLTYNAPEGAWRATVIGIPGYFEAVGYETAYNKMVAYLKTLPDGNAAKGNPVDRYEVRVGSSVKISTTDFREAHASYDHWVKDAERRNGSSQEVVLLGNGKVLASFSLHGAKVKENPVSGSNVTFVFTSVLGNEIYDHLNAMAGTVDSDPAHNEGTAALADYHVIGRGKFKFESNNEDAVLGIYSALDWIADRYGAQDVAPATKIAAARYKKELDQQYFTQENPVRYSTSFTYRDVMVHVHEDNGTFCADYRAIDRFVPKSGGRVCANKQSAAMTTAKRRIDDILARVAPTASAPKRAPFLSPWD